MLISQKTIKEQPTRGAVIIPQNLLNSYHKLANTYPTEVNARHKVQCKAGIFYFTDDIFVPKQICTGVTTERKASAYIDMSKSVQFNCDIHTHPMDSIVPSVTDIDNFLEWSKFCDTYQLNIIISPTLIGAYLYGFRGILTEVLDVFVDIGNGQIEDFDSYFKTIKTLFKTKIVISTPKYSWKNNNPTIWKKNNPTVIGHSLNQKTLKNIPDIYDEFAYEEFNDWDNLPIENDINETTDNPQEIIVYEGDSIASFEEIFLDSSKVNDKKIVSENDFDDLIYSINLYGDIKNTDTNKKLDKNCEILKLVASFVKNEITDIEFIKYLEDLKKMNKLGHISIDLFYTSLNIND